jgi:branched-chain amino acid transport system substrate-binding protein
MKDISQIKGGLEKMRYISRKLLAIAVALVLFFMFDALGSTQKSHGQGSKSAPARELKLGWMAGITGFLSELGLNTKEVTDWAVEQANQAGGINGMQIKIVYADTKIDPQLARQSAERLIMSDKVPAIIGDYYTPNTDAILEIVEKAKVPLITPGSGGIMLTKKGYKYIFRGCYSSEFDATIMGQYAVETLKAKRIVILGGSDSFSRSVGDAFQKYVKDSGKAEIVGYDTYDRATTKDFTNLLLKYKSNPPDAIYLSGSQADGGLIAKQAVEAGMKTKFLGNLAQTKTAYYEIGGKATVGTIATTSFTGMAENYKDFAEPSTVKFIETFVNKFKKTPTLDHAQGYDATNMLLEAIRRAKSTDGEKIRQGLLSLTDYRGAVGTIKMLPNGDILVKMFLVQLMEGGKWKVLAAIMPKV